MLKIVLLDDTAEERTRLHQLVSDRLAKDVEEAKFLPPINLKPLAIEELKFHARPDILIVGSGVVARDLVALRKISEGAPGVPLIAVLPEDLQRASTFDQLSRLGVSEVLIESDPSEVLYRKIIFLARSRGENSETGKLVVVDSGKGGVGCTSIVAAIGESLVESGKRVGLIDFDINTQNLTRFLQAKPFINENLQLLINRSKPVTEELVEQCFAPVWSDSDSIRIMAPPFRLLGDDGGIANTERILLSILMIARMKFDVLLVDRGSLPEELMEPIYSRASKVLSVVSNDPASVYSSITQVKRIKSIVPNLDTIKLLENRLTRNGLASKWLSSELLSATGLSGDGVFCASLNYSKTAYRWPGSGMTLYSLGDSKARKAFRAIASELELLEAELTGDGIARESSWSSFGSRLAKRLPSPRVFPQGKDRVAIEESLLPVISKMGEEKGPVARTSRQSEGFAPKFTEPDFQ